MAEANDPSPEYMEDVKECATIRRRPLNVFFNPVNGEWQSTIHPILAEVRHFTVLPGGKVLTFVPGGGE